MQLFFLNLLLHGRFKETKSLTAIHDERFHGRPLTSL